MAVGVLAEAGDLRLGSELRHVGGGAERDQEGARAGAAVVGEEVAPG